MTKPQEASHPTSPPIVRTTAGLREALFDQLDSLRNRIINPTQANAFSKTVAEILDAVRVDLEVYKITKGLPKDEPLELAPRIPAMYIGGNENE